MNSAALNKTVNEAVALHQRGDLEKAEALYRAVLKKMPHHFDALHLLGVLLEQRGDLTGGIALIRDALKIQGASPEAHFNLGRLLYAEGDMAGAERHLAQAIALKPGLAAAHNALGNLYRRISAYDAAAAAFERAIRHEPGFVDAYINLSNTYRDNCNEAKILDVADRGLRIDPRCAKLWLLRAEAAFTTGHLAEGWRDYAWRFSSTERPVDIHRYDLPTWNGEDLREKGILIWCEQGVGDEIIFASMIPGIASKAKRCVLHTTPRLAPLFARAFPNVEVFGEHVPADIARTLDFQSSMGGVGQWQRPSFRSFPAATDYLKANLEKAATLRAKYIGNTKTLLVGLAWRSAVVSDAAEKSISLSQWGAILSVPGVTFVNLQYGDTSVEVAAARTAFKATIIEDSTVDNLADLDGFAAQVAAMDLVISSSNTAAHIAGALGVPTWCMVPRALGNGRRWYWFGAGTYTPWYRAMTLFRQSRTDWMDVLADVAASLVTSAAKAGSLTDPGRYLESLAQAYVGAGLEREAAKVQSQAAILTLSPRASLEAARINLKVGALSAALDAIVQAAASPNASAEAHDMHGRILAKLDLYEEAVSAYQKALVLEPTIAEIYNNMGTALRRAGRETEAERSYAHAHRLKPDHPSILLNYAAAQAENHRPEDALAAYDQLLSLKPDYADAHYNRAAALMDLGRFAEGWKEFEWRLRRGTVHVRHDNFPQPVWAGETLATKHILIWTDLGLGEEVLAASFVPDAAKAARHVTLLCSARLLTLFRRSFPNVTVDVRAAPLPSSAVSKDIDLQMSLAELGAAFRPSFESFPARERFLAANVPLRDQLRQKYLAGRENTKLVGIAWRSVHPEIGRQKSLSLPQWLPILKTPGVTFVNLQYGDCQAELAALNQEYGITVINDPDINYFGDIDPVAAQVAAMDMVVSVSNTTAHLAGALGVPAWVMAPRGLGRLWYWFRGSTRCPWYSRLVLGSPDEDNGWEQLIQKVAVDLQKHVDVRHE